MDNPYAPARGKQVTWERVEDLRFDLGRSRVSEGPEGLGGWLILVMLGLLSTLLSALPAMRIQLAAIAGGHVAARFDSGSPVYDPLAGALVCGELLATAGIVVGVLVLVGLYVAKSRWFPRGYIGLMIYVFAAQVLDHTVALGMGAIGSDEFSERLRGMVPRAVTAAIWICYMLLSKRVRNTFRH